MECSFKRSNSLTHLNSIRKKKIWRPKQRPALPPHSEPAILSASKWCYNSLHWQGRQAGSGFGLCQIGKLANTLLFSDALMEIYSNANYPNCLCLRFKFLYITLQYEIQNNIKEWVGVPWLSESLILGSNTWNVDTNSVPRSLCVIC